MSKNRKKLKAKKVKDSTPSATENVAQTLPEGIQTENSFDFGGITPRDLKKNLGCG